MQKKKYSSAEKRAYYFGAGYAAGSEKKIEYITALTDAEGVSLVNGLSDLSYLDPHTRLRKKSVIGKGSGYGKGKK